MGFQISDSSSYFCSAAEFWIKPSWDYTGISAFGLGWFLLRSALISQHKVLYLSDGGGQSWCSEFYTGVNLVGVAGSVHLISQRPWLISQ